MTLEKIAEGGEKLLLMITVGKLEKTMDKLRYIKFSPKVETSNKDIEPESIGPTSNAVHSLRVYFQVQSWLGRDNLEVLEWDWVLTSQMLMPIMMSLAVAPQDLLKLIRYTCISDCRGRCICYI